MNMGTWHDIAVRCGASKSEHTYMPNYERLLKPLRDEPINLLEIGICNGGSLKTWLAIFPNAYVYGVDVVNNVRWTHERCTIHVCDQFSDRLATLFPPESLDVVIDDGSHVFHHQTKARESLWPALKPGGWYFVEDIIDLNDIRYWATFERFAVFTRFMRRINNETRQFDQRHSLDDVLVAIRKMPCPPAWEW